MHYGRLVLENQDLLKFPALKSLNIEDWTTRLIRSAAEEQVHGLGSNPAARKRCRLGCNAYENSYHVISACITPAYTSRHDYIVYRILKSIMIGSQAPEEILAQLKFRKASIVVEYKWGERDVKIRAGPKIMTDPELHHNRPDIMVILTNPNIVYVLEIAVAHLQNIRVQEQVKKVRYSKNSTEQITHTNYAQVHRDYNLIEALSNMYKCPAKLAIFIFGALGEILETEAMQAARKVLSALGVNHQQLEQLMELCSLTAAKESTKIIMRRLNLNSNVQ